MVTMKADLPKSIDEIELYIFADEHIGDKFSDLDYLKERIEYVRTHPNCYAVLNGDIINNATKTSISDIYSESLMPQEQIDLATELFKPIAKKILCATGGNHEARTYKKEGLDPMRQICQNIGIVEKYSPTAIVLFLKFGQYKDTKCKGRKVCYSFYITHGSGGGRKEGAKAIRLADLASICDCDIYCVGHTHLPLTMKEDFVRVDHSNSTIKNITKLFVNSSANLNYGGYGEVIGCKPASKVKPVIHLYGDHKEATVTL